MDLGWLRESPVTLVDFMAAGGKVTLLGQQIEERLTPRQLRYLFAIGAVARGQGAGVAAGQASRQQRRAAISHGIQTQRRLVGFQKSLGLASLKQTVPFMLAKASDKKVMLRAARQKARLGVKQFGRPFGVKRPGSITRPIVRSTATAREASLRGAVRGVGLMALAGIGRLRAGLA